MKSLCTRILLLAAFVVFPGRPPCATAADATGPATLPAPEGLHLFLLVGQSNMAGRGEVEAEDRAVDPRILTLNAENQWVPAVDPIHFDKPVAGTGLARSFAMAYLADHPGVTVGLIPCACGGSPIAAWLPGAYFEQTQSHPYDDAIRRVGIARQHGTLKGILWHQGESDSNPDLAPRYEAGLIELITRFRRDLGADDVPFILGQLGRFESAPWDESKIRVDTAIRNIAAHTARIGFVSSAGLTCKADNIHFDSRSLREFGRRYYAVFKATAASSSK